MIESLSHQSLQSLFLFLAQEAQEQPKSDGVLSPLVLSVLAVVAVLVIPIFVGKFLAKSLKMPTHDARIGMLAFSILASATILYFGKLDYGVDLRGGTILVYELDPKAILAKNEEGGDTRVSSADVIPALTKRINPAGTLEIVIRPYGEDQIEIIIPDTDTAAVDAVKRQITEAGILRFAILANRDDHRALIETAEEASRSSDRQRVLSRVVSDSSGRALGFWADVDREDEDSEGVRALRVDVTASIVRNPDTGQILQVPMSLAAGEQTGKNLALWVASQGLRELQTLMVLDEKLGITGEDLAFVSQSYDEQGRPSVRFSLKDAGSSRFYALTLNNSPKGGRERQLGIILDNRLLSAPGIRNAIRGDGTISGNFSLAEVQFLVNILRAGQLPAALNKVPISENQIGSTLGADTIRKGVTAIAGSLVAVLLFVIFYYRLAGFIACFALLLNLVMTLAVMILINQPLTLPGLAGLVLTVGMSVDANVLIFERIREEIRKGAAARMAVRNGFARATTTIVDANLTTLITAIVLYTIGTDQIRGFAATLILGIIFSMFTAIYVSRTIFDIAERHRKLSLSMSDMVMILRNAFTGNKDFDFMGKGSLCIGISVVLMIVGVASLLARGKDILDIDFAGGSSVTFQLDKALPPDEVRKIVGEAIKDDDETTSDGFTLNSVEVANAEKNTVYKIDSGFQDDAELKSRLLAGFTKSQAASLVTYQAEVILEKPSNPANSEQPEAAQPAEGATGYLPRPNNGIYLVSTFPQEQDASAEASTPAEPVAPAEVAPADNTAAEVVPTDAPQAVTPSAESATTGTAPTSGGEQVISERIVSEATVKLSVSGTGAAAPLNFRALQELVVNAAKESGVTLEASGVDAIPSGDGSVEWTRESSLSFSDWKLILDLPAEDADKVLVQFMNDINTNPVWLSSNEISGRVAGQMIQKATTALFASLLFIIGYIWFRFQRVAFGLAAVVALIHDVLITLGAIAISYWAASFLGFLGIEQFKVSLTVIAALLTIVGYSLNDTIVVFDRIREVRGKSPRLTSEMINVSVNQTLSRTLLTSGTTLLVVVLLYFFGGPGIHAFAFSLLVGVTVGTYSSIFVASPILLWLVNRDMEPAVNEGGK